MPTHDGEDKEGKRKEKDSTRSYCRRRCVAQEEIKHGCNEFISGDRRGEWTVAA